MSLKRQIFSEKPFMRGLVSHLNLNDNVYDFIANKNWTINNNSYSGNLSFVSSPLGKALKSSGGGRGSYRYPNASTSAAICDATKDLPFVLYYNFRYTANTGSWYGMIGGKYYIGTAGTEPEFAVFLTTENKILFRQYDQSSRVNYKSIITNTSITINQWYKLVITGDGVSDPKIYIDGQEVATIIEITNSYVRMTPSTKDFLSIMQSGYVTPNTQANFFGEVDEFAMWSNRFFTDDEVKLLTNRQFELL